MEKWKMLEKCKLRKQFQSSEVATGDALWKKLFLNWMKWDKILLCFIFIWYYYICITSRSSRTVVFYKKVFLKNSQNLHGNTCTGFSFLSAASNFINEETPVQSFPKPLNSFEKRPI